MHDKRLRSIVIASILATVSACSSGPAATATPDAAANDRAAVDAPAPPPDDVPPPPPDVAPVDDAAPARGGPCRTPFDCANDLAGSVCLFTNGSPEGRCVECAPGMLCPDGATVCNARGTCSAACVGDDDCADSDRGPLCDTATGACVRCRTRGDCPGSSSYCNVAANRCDLGCGADADCAGRSSFGTPTPRCDVAGHTCEECVTDAHCGAGRVCDRLQRCVAGCSAESPCPSGRSCCSGACVDTSASLTNCGACGNACRAAARASATCVCRRMRRGRACAAGRADCDRSTANGCEVDVAASLANCGACGNACPARPNAAATCAAGACGVACDAGFADCDRDPANGCEVDTRAAAASCGRCGNACAAGLTCVSGVCSLVCAAPLVGCGMACVDTGTSLANCGACGNACPAVAHASATCAAGRCGFTCAAGFADCDGDPANGCEADTRTSLAHCGACGRACGVANGSGACAAGACALRCDAGFTLVGGACVATNPCTTGNGGCDANATCAPGAPGARTCACNSGFVGDGVTCMPESTCAPVCAAGQTCVNRVCVGNGPLRVSLTWDVAGDMDLHLVPPGGAEIYYNRRAVAGGQLDRDDTTGTGPENVYWSATPPSGTYLVCVVPYRIPRATNFTLTVNRPGMPAQRFTGSRAASSGNAACSATSPHFVGMFTL
ncbi:MAG: hypothetical protein U0325_35970 [Polyangiales bacterium]